jgi:hypothetical protein
MTTVSNNNVVRSFPRVTSGNGSAGTSSVGADVKATAKTNAVAADKGAATARVGDSFEVASTRGGPSRPTASRPAPTQLSNQFHGQVGPSSNQTGKIGGAAELAQFVNAGYNGGKFGPVSITPATLREGGKTTPVHLVGISGTEAVKGQSTGWITNLKSGFEQNNPGLRNAKDAILRTVPAGSNLVLAGHSQGGMIAQQLAADPDIKSRYNVMSTTTFGSPLIGLGRREGEVHRIAAAGDPVPRASAASSLNLASGAWAAAGQQNIRTDFPISLHKPGTYGNGITAHNKDYTNENNPELKRMDVLGRNNPRVPATLEFNPANRVFFSSPTNTSAP